MSEALSFFTHAVERAAGGSKRFIDRVEVLDLPEVGWRLEVSLKDGRGLALRASLDDEPSYRQGRVFGWSYEPQGPGVDGVAARLCERLAADAEAVPEALRSPPVAAEELEFERVDIYLAGDCDRACVFCANTRDPARVRGKHLDVFNDDYQWRRLEERLRKLAEERDPAATRIEWSGRDSVGSPFFDRAITLAHELGFGPMSAQTPGSRFVDRDFVQRAASLGLHHVSLTAHGFTKETFDTIGGYEGAYDAFWKGVENLREASISLYFEVPFIRENVHELPDLTARLVEEGAPISLFYWHADPGSEQEYRERPLGLGDLPEVMSGIAARVPARSVSIVGVPHCARPPALVEHFLWGHTNHHPLDNHHHADECGSCLARETCPGLPRGYWAHYPALPAIVDPDDPRL